MGIMKMIIFGMVMILSNNVLTVMGDDDCHFSFLRGIIFPRIIEMSSGPKKWKIPNKTTHDCVRTRSCTYLINHTLNCNT